MFCQRPGLRIAQPGRFRISYTPVRGFPADEVIRGDPGGGSGTGVALRDGCDYGSASRMVALARPPASHMVCRAYRAPRRRMAPTSVVINRLPLAPSG
jgi:hypothetical protein